MIIQFISMQKTQVLGMFNFVVLITGVAILFCSVGVNGDSYANCLSLPALNAKITLEWNVNQSSSFLDIRVTSTALGWTGIGFHSIPCIDGNNCMAGSDFVVLQVGSSNLMSLYKPTGSGDGQPEDSTTQIIQTNIIEQSNTRIQYSFIRAFNTGTVTISPGTNQAVLYAWAPSGTFGYHGINRNIMAIDWGAKFSNCSVTGITGNVLTTGSINTSSTITRSITLMAILALLF